MRERYYKENRQTPKNLIYGIHPIMESIHAGKEIEKILLARDIGGSQVRELVKAANELHIPIQKVPAEKLNSLTKSNHQGIVAFLSLIEYQPIEDILMQVFENGEQALILILDRVTDVRNFGAIVRSAECSGVHVVIIPSQGSAAINADAIKTSAGALNITPIHRSENLKNTLKYLRDSGVKIVAVTEYAQTSYTDYSFEGPLALILGSEEDGISPEYLKLCHDRVKIPLHGTIGSLNVSVAAAVTLFEAVRQRNITK